VGADGVFCLLFHRAGSRNSGLDRETGVRRRRERPANEPTIPASILAAHSTATGRLESEEDLILAGTFEGNLRSARSVQLLAGSRIRGDVHASEIIVQGVVHGNLLARQRIRILQGGDVNGDVCAPQVTVQEGVALNARVRMLANTEETREVLLPVMLRPAAGMQRREATQLLDATEEFLETLGFVCETRPRPAAVMRCIFRSLEPMSDATFRGCLQELTRTLRQAAEPSPPDESLPTGPQAARAFLEALGESAEVVAVLGITVVHRRESGGTWHCDVEDRPEFLPEPDSTPVLQPAVLLLDMQRVQEDILGSAVTGDAVSPS